jgi:hypothetical protein
MRAGGRLEITWPEGWFAIDLAPATAQSSAGRLVDSWAREHPDLAEHRDRLVDLLVGTAERARQTQCVYAAGAFGADQSGPTYAGLVARILGWPGTVDVDQFLEGMAAAARHDDAVTAAEVVQIAGRRMALVRQSPPDGSAVTSFLVPARERGVFVNVEFSSPAAPAPEHTFAHIVATVRVR